ncbi:DUF1501 domain-containing protein [Alphaproteobacteria bacterium]|nr:DUF1501 domain-containing protein [Alphaproteobacteria bacterium]
MIISRRNILIGSSALFLLGKASPIFADQKKKKNLIIIMLRGGMDGLTAVPLRNDNDLQIARPDIFIKNLRQLNSDFNLHPKLKSFHTLWKKHQAAIVHATNIPYTGRSHFDGQNLMQSGGIIPYQIKTGWLGRGIEVSELQGLSLSLPMPLLLRGSLNPDNYFPSKWSLPNDNLLDIIKSSYKNEDQLYSTLDKIRSRPISMTGMSSNLYKSRNLITLAKSAALQLSKKNGPRVAVFDINGFDTHSAQGGSNGRHGSKLKEVDNIISQLKTNLGKNFENTLILTLTEFGRTVNQNGGYGTDHGFGSAILMAGGLIKSSQVYTDWPGLKKSNLFEGRDLKSTIDARSVYCSAMAVCFDIDFQFLKRKVFGNEPLENLTSKLFKI